MDTLAGSTCREWLLPTDGRRTLVLELSRFEPAGTLAVVTPDSLEVPWSPAPSEDADVPYTYVVAPQMPGPWRVRVWPPMNEPNWSYAIVHRFQRPSTRAERDQWGAAYHEAFAVRAAARGQAEMAQGHSAQAMRLLRRLHRGQPLALADALERLGAGLFGPDALLPALLPIFQEIVLLREKAVGPDAGVVAHSLTNLATIQHALGQYDAAADNELRAHALRELSGLLNEQDLARGRRELAVTLTEVGRFQEALALLDSSLAEVPRWSTPDSLLLADAFNTRAEVLRSLGELGQADADFWHAWRILAAIGAAPDEPDRYEAWLDLAFGVLINRGGAQTDRGQYAAAEPFYQDAWELVEPSPSLHARRAMALRNLGYVLHKTHRLAEADTLLHQALREARTIPMEDPSELGWCHLELGELRQRQQRPAESARSIAVAESCFAQLDVSRSYEAAHAMLQAGDLLHRMGDCGAARSTYDRAARRFADVYGTNGALVGRALARSGVCQQQDLAVSRDAAHATLESALAILQATPEWPEDRCHARAALARVMRAQGEREVARSQLRQALDEIEQLRVGVGTRDRSVAEFVVSFLDYAYLFAQWCAADGQIDLGFEYVERFRARALLARLLASRVERDAAGGPASTGSGPSVAPSDSLRAAQMRLAEAQRRLELAAQSAGLRADERERELRHWRPLYARAYTDLQTHEAALRVQDRAWGGIAGPGGQPIDIARVQDQLLEPGEALLMYLLGTEGASVLLVPPAPGRPSLYPLQVPAPPSATGTASHMPLTATWVQLLLEGKKTPAEIGATGEILALLATRPYVWPARADIALHQLFRALVPPELWATIAGLDEVVIVPDGPLHALPFEALVVQDVQDTGDVRYWLDLGPAIRYAPSATVLWNLQRADQGPRGAALPVASALVIADPIFERAPGGSAAKVDAPRMGSLFVPHPDADGSRTSGCPDVPLERLRFASAEAEAITRALRPLPVRLLLRDAATEANFRSLAPAAGVLHFATHGVLCTERGEVQARLEMTPDARGDGSAADDGRLHVDEIYTLPLRCDLVTLSACDTHAGQSVRGEGIFALSRSFLAAGCSRVVGTLWRVDDEASASLMAGFYGSRGEIWRDPLAPEASLRTTARSLRDAKRQARATERWALPYYWAPFVAIGAR